VTGSLSLLVAAWWSPMAAAKRPMVWSLWRQQTAACVSGTLESSNAAVDRLWSWGHPCDHPKVLVSALSRPIAGAWGPALSGATSVDIPAQLFLIRLGLHPIFPPQARRPQIRVHPRRLLERFFCYLANSATTFSHHTAFLHILPLSQYHRSTAPSKI
jgi:hypothetical protein